MSDSIKSLVRNYFSVQMCSFWGVTFREMDNFRPFLTPRVLQKRSETMISTKWVTVQNLWSEIISLCKYPAFGYYFIGNGEFWPSLLTPFWPQEARKMTLSWKERHRLKKVKLTSKIFPRYFINVPKVLKLKECVPFPAYLKIWPDFKLHSDRYINSLKNFELLSIIINSPISLMELFFW